MGTSSSLAGVVVPSSVVWQFELPGHGTWCALCIALVLAIFYQFNRPLALRNFDLLGLFLFIPGLLLVEQAERATTNEPDRVRRLELFGYGILLLGCLGGIIRAFFDISAIKRARISPNLTIAGLLFLALALFVAMAWDTFSRAATQNPRTQGPVPSLAALQAETSLVYVRVGWAIACHLGVMVLLVVICRRHFQDLPAGAGSALLYLLLPSTLLAFAWPAQVWSTLLILGAIAGYRSPWVAGALTGLAAGSAILPGFLFPAWYQFYRERGAWSFTLAFVVSVGIGAGLNTGVVALLGESFMMNTGLQEWQPWRVPSLPGIWTGAHWAYRVPLFVAYVGFVIGSAIWPSTRNLGQLIAVSAIILIGPQFWLAEAAGRSITWFSPLLLLLVFRPTTIELQPPSSTGKSGVFPGYRPPQGTLS